ncbi:MAG: restriction endonuclease [Rhizobiaceae bacterium]|nr:restriction endonuclease [Rhizobiaceae bacterium]
MKLIADESLIPGWQCYNWRNARVILENSFQNEWKDIIEILNSFRIRHSDLAAKGRGNKTAMSANIDGQFYSRGWQEKQFRTAVKIDDDLRETPTHDIDCFKNKVALELEWNNKDPFYDRDLNNFRLLYDLGAADVGVMVTRATSLMRWLTDNHKRFGKASGTYGSSTTHFDKLEPRILGGGAGGCPVFVLAMTEQLYYDDR